jgi:general secretion pathway protein D
MTLHLRLAFARSLRFLGLSLLFTAALAQQLVHPTVSGSEVRFRSDALIRYYVDHQRFTVELPGVQLADTSVYYPSGFVVRQHAQGLTLELGQPFRLALSPDQRTLTVVRSESYGSVPTLIGGDARAPVVYYLSNADPLQLSGLLMRLYEGLQVEVDVRQRALLVMVNPDDRPLVDGLVATLDAPRPQVMFEAEILEINQDITRSLGIQYDSIFTFTLAEGEGGSLARVGPIGRTPFSLSFGINMLKVNGAARVLAQPRVTTLDGVEAQLDATQTVPVIVPGSGNQQSVQNITTGIRLRMLPRIGPSGTIEAELSISVSTPTGVTAQGIPQFSSREANTTVRVANGEAIAIGGLLEQRRIEGTSKVPILGDIPLLGALFTSTRIEERETDLVIIVTPRIVELPTLPALPVVPPQRGE